VNLPPLQKTKAVKHGIVLCRTGTSNSPRVYSKSAESPYKNGEGEIVAGCGEADRINHGVQNFTVGQSKGSACAEAVRRAWPAPAARQTPLALVKCKSADWRRLGWQWQPAADRAAFFLSCLFFSCDDDG